MNELDLKDGIVLELQEKNGALRVELENLEMEKRQVNVLFFSENGGPAKLIEILATLQS